MPSNIKAGISLIVLIVGAAAWYFELLAGKQDAAYAAAGLAVFMVLAMWIFPETGGRDKNRE